MRYLVVGLGATGQSCVRFLNNLGESVVVTDNRKEPPQLFDFKKQFPNVLVHTGAFSQAVFDAADVIVVSPGVSLNAPEIERAIASGKSVIGDIELFVQQAKAPIIAVTGSNGKSTLVTLIGQMIKDSGKQAIVCGNIGVPVLDVLVQPTPDFYVLELSSFQLESVFSLQARVAVLLNLSPDHLDRHGSMAAYKKAKQRVYQNCHCAIVNADEPDLWQDLNLKKMISFSTQNPDLKREDSHAAEAIQNPDRKGGGSHSINNIHDQQAIPTVKTNWALQPINTNRSPMALMRNNALITPIDTLFSQSYHNCQNMLAALAVGEELGLPLEKMIGTLQTFKGLAHRCVLLQTDDGVFWYNDSKATNVGAAVAAIDSVSRLHQHANLYLIAGGDSKGVDLSALRQPIQQRVRSVILLGVDAKKMAEALSGAADIDVVDNMREAVALARTKVQRGDVVLLSPACSSLDQYPNFMVRGEDFMRAVEAV